MKKQYQLPVFIEKDEDGFYVVECPYSLAVTARERLSMRR